MAASIESLSRASGSIIVSSACLRNASSILVNCSSDIFSGIRLVTKVTKSCRAANVSASRTETFLCSAPKRRFNRSIGSSATESSFHVFPHHMMDGVGSGDNTAAHNAGECR